MLELPGMKTTGDPRLDLDNIRRYLSRLVPQLEMELMNAGTDDYQSEYNARAQNIGTGKSGTTAGALAAHVLDLKNPHNVTLAQLGFSYDKFVSIDITVNGLMIRCGQKQGLQINIQQAQVELDTWEQANQIYHASADLGEWDRQLPLILYAGATVNNGGTDCWAGSLTGTDAQHIGTVQIYRLGPEWEPGPVLQTEEQSEQQGAGGGEGRVGDEEEEQQEVRTVCMTIIGVGVFGYGEE